MTYLVESANRGHWLRSARNANDVFPKGFVEREPFGL